MKQQATSGTSGRWRALLFLPLLAVFVFFALPAAQRQASGVLSHFERSEEQRFAERTTGFGPLLHEVQSRVSPDEPILIEVPKRASPLYWDHVIHYWLYPRKVYSVAALREAGENVRRFIQEQGIRWRYSKGRLQNLTGLSPPPTRTQPLCSLHAGDAVRVGLGLLLALAHFLVVGALLLVGIDRQRVISARFERIALSYLLGTGAVGVWAVLCFAIGIGVRLSTLSCSLLLALGFFALRCHRDTSRCSSTPDTLRGVSEADDLSARASSAPASALFRRLDATAVLIAVLLVAVLTLRAAAMPMGGYDARYQWAHKAHVMLHEDSLWGAGFQDPLTLHPHPRYPLLIPGIEAAIFSYAGGFNDQYVMLFFPLFLGALLVVLYHGLGALGRRRGRGLAVLAVLLVPGYWGYGIARDGAAAFSAYTDLPLSFFATAAMIYLLRARTRPSNHLYVISALLILFCGLTKAEGKVHFLVFVILALAPLALRARPRTHRQRALAAFGGAGILLALYELAVVLPTQVGMIPDNYAELLHWKQVAGNFERVPDIAWRMAREYFLSPRFGFPGLVLAAATLFLIQGRSAREALRPLGYVAITLMLFAGPYLVLPEEIWERNYNWSAGRLMLQLVPMTFLAVAMLVLPRPHAEGASSTDGPSRAVDSSTRNARLERA